MRIRLIYSKGDKARFLGHLDVLRVFRMAFLRAGWPLVMTQGFSPRPKMSFYSPLPVGTAGCAEILDVWVDDKASLKGLVGDLKDELPLGFRLVSAEKIPDDSVSLEPLIKASLYWANLGAADVSSLRSALSKFLKEDSVAFNVKTPKKSRTLDLRPFLLSGFAFEKEDSKCSSCIVLSLEIAHSGGKTARPAWILEALNGYGFSFPPEEAIIDRRKILFDNSRDEKREEGTPKEGSA